MGFAEVPCEAKEDTMERMMAQYGRSLKRMCYLYLRDAHWAEDAAQETFLKAYRHLSGFRGDCGEQTWLMRIAMNVCRDMLRTAWFRRVDRRVTPEDIQAPDERVHDEDGCVVEEVMRLPVKYKEVILLYYYQNMNTGEIARALGIPVNTVKSRLLRGKQQLRERLEGWYFDA